MMDINALFESRLNDLYSAEDYFMIIMPKMLAQTDNESLRDILLEELEITKKSKENLIAVSDRLNLKQGIEISAALEKTMGEIDGILKPEKTGDVKIEALIRAAHQIALYEIAAYITLISYADELAYTSVSASFEKTLKHLFYVAQNLKNRLRSRVGSETV